MAGKSAFSVVISATDKASGTLASINKRLEAVNATAAKAREPFDKLAANYNKFLQLSGADKIAGGLGRVARAGFSAFQSLTRIVEPLAAIVGAASIAGMYRLATAWANFGSQLGNAAQRAGLSAEQLHGLQNAAFAAGVSAEALTGGMTTLKDNMSNAVAGKAPQVVSMIQALGLSLDQVAKQTPNEQLKTFADRIAALKDPTLQAQAATALFGGAGEELLPFLRKGSAGIEEYTRKAERYGLINAAGVKAANDLREAQAWLTIAVKGLGNSVAQKLGPVLVPLLNQMAEWVASNRDWIATGIGEAVQAFANYIRSVDWNGVGQSIKHIYEAVKGVADALGGWKAAGLDILRFMVLVWAVPILASIVKIGMALGGIPGKAAAAATAANAELGKIGGNAGLLKGLGLGAMLGMVPDILSGAMGDRAAKNLDENDHRAFNDVQPPKDTRTWYERLYKPGPGLVGGSAAPDRNQLRLQAEGRWAHEPPPTANSNLANRGHDPNAERRDTSLPSGPNTRGASRVGYTPDAASEQAPGQSRSTATASHAEFYKTYGPAADRVGQQIGVDRNVILGHWAQETAYGRNVHDFNVGNMQAGSGYTGRTVVRGDTHADGSKYQTKFRAYDTPEQFGDDYARLLKRRYPGALGTGSDALRFGQGLKAGGYMENPNGPQDIANTAHRVATEAPAPSGPAVNLPTNAGTAANPGGAGVVPNGEVNVGVKLEGLPPGARTTATQSGQGMAPLKVERSNVGFGHAA